MEGKKEGRKGGGRNKPPAYYFGKPYFTLWSVEEDFDVMSSDAVAQAAS